MTAIVAARHPGSAGSVEDRGETGAAGAGSGRAEALEADRSEVSTATAAPGVIFNFMRSP